MKRVVFAAAFVSAAISFGATSARAGEEPVVVDAVRVTYYVELGDLDAAKADALAARLKREFPKAQVELIEGTLRIQTDNATLDGIDKLLHAEHIVGIGASTVRKQTIVVGAPDAAAAQEKQAKNAAKDGRLRTKIKVGELCEGCADCLAALLSKEFPALGFLPEEGRVEVVAAKEDLANVEAFLRKLGEQLGAQRKAPKAVEFDVDGTQVLVVGGDGTWFTEDGGHKFLRYNFDAGGDPKVAEKIAELERRLAEAMRAGRRDEAQKLERALADVRAAKSGMPRFEFDPQELQLLRERLEKVKARLAAADGNSEEREALEGARRRLEEAKERLEASGRSLARGGGGRGGAGGGAPPRPPQPPEPPERFHGGVQPWNQGRHDAPAGPLAELRQRVQHLMQAAEHLNAAGYEGLAKQATEAAEQSKRQAEEVARAMRADEEARAAAMKQEMADRQERLARERKEAERTEDARRAAGLVGPKELSDIRAEELVDLIRALNQQVNALREEMKALREQVGRDRPAVR